MRSSPTTSRKVRGFTLVELMVVVVIIAVLAVIAVPLFSARLQGRRVFQVAGRIADLYRGSRTRALGRGAAVVVRLDQGTHTFQVLEGVEGTAVATASGKANCANLPTRGCLTNDWSNLGSGATIGTARKIEGIGNEAILTSVKIGSNPADTGLPLALCYSPAGRTYYNVGTTFTPDAWQPLTNVVTLQISSTNPASTTPRQYNVVLMPNGTARLAL